MTNKYTSLLLSRKLAQAGCKIKSGYCWVFWEGKWKLVKMDEYGDGYRGRYFAYDILWNICIRHTKEFFGEKYKVRTPGGLPMDYTEIAQIILILLQKDKKKEAEDIIWRATIFNPKNK